MKVLIERVAVISEEVVAAFDRLIGQLTDSNTPPDRARLEELVAWPATTMLVARAPDAAGPIVATATFILVKSPAAVHARLEDLVVDEAMRGQGVGEALTAEVISRATAAGAGYVALTSNPRRAAANRLYRRMGFKIWETNIYRYDLAQ